MRLYNYLENVEVKETNVTCFDVEIKGITSRSYEVKEGYIFVCIKGLKNDGHLFIESVKENGCAFLVVEYVNEQIISCGLPYIRVENTRKVLALMCAKRYGNPEREVKMVAVTGTNGKTSTCRILSEIYGKSGMIVDTYGTLDGGLTTDDSEDLFKKLRHSFDNGFDTIVMEASSHALALDKLFGVEFDNSVFTNLTEEHLDFHLNMDNYASAKAKLFSSSKLSVLNYDNSYFERVGKDAKGRKYFYSLNSTMADYYIENLKMFGAKGFEYDLVTPKCRVEIKSELCGYFNVYNTMAAATAALCDGVDPIYVQQGINCVKNVKGRLEKVELPNNDLNLYIDYAHTPDALEKVLKCIRDFKEDNQKITVLFGCGGDRDKTKRSVMGKIASKLADFTVITSDNSRSEDPICIIKDILKGIDKERPYKVIENRKEAIEYVIMNSCSDDIILLAGKGHEDYEIDLSGKRYFSEIEIAVNAAGKRFKKNDY